MFGKYRLVLQTSTLAAEHVALGNFGEAQQLLGGELSREVALKILLTQKQLVTQVPYLHASALHVLKDNAVAILSPSLAEVRQLAKQGYKTTTEGKFSETLQLFSRVREWVRYVKPSENDKDDVQALAASSVEYCLAMKCELRKKTESAARQLELGCYMACFNLQPAHRVLTLRSAMSLAYKQKNFITCNHSHLSRKHPKSRASSSPSSKNSPPSPSQRSSSRPRR